MLIITRKIDQVVIIGTATVMVLGIERDRVKLGIDAPKNVGILREELAARAYDEATKPTPIRKEQ